MTTPIGRGFRFVIKIAAVLYFLSLSAIAHASSSTIPFSGEWEWTGAPDSRTFSIDLKQQGRQLVGQYCAVAQNGNKIDCDDEKNPNMHGELDKTGRSALVEFSSYFGGRNGRAMLKISKGRVIWHITKDPVGGQFYAPKDAVLDRP